MARLLKSDLVRIAENVQCSARENAIETVIENTTIAERAELEYFDQHPQYVNWYRSTAEMVLDGLGGRDCTSYGCEKPLTAKQIEKVRAILVSNCQWIFDTR